MRRACAAWSPTGRDPARRAHVIARVLIEFLERDHRRAGLYVESVGHPSLRARREEPYGAFAQLVLDARPLDPGSHDPDPLAGQHRDGVVAEIARMIRTAVRPATAA